MFLAYVRGSYTPTLSIEHGSVIVLRGACEAIQPLFRAMISSRAQTTHLDSLLKTALRDRRSRVHEPMDGMLRFFSTGRVLVLNFVHDSCNIFWKALSMPSKTVADVFPTGRSPMRTVPTSCLTPSH